MANRSRGWDVARSMRIAEATLSAEGLTVTGALARVMAELPGITKGNKSPEGYSYRGIEAITRQLQPLLAAHGVVISPKACITSVVPSPAMKDGWQDVYMTVEWTITGPDGSTLAAQTCGVGRDRSDKGANKAQTQAFKYLLLHLLCIADGKDDTDNHSYEKDRREARPLDVDAFVKSCTDVGVDPADVLAHAELEKSLDELSAEDRPALKASLAALTKVEGGNGSAEPGSAGQRTEAQDGPVSGSDATAEQLAVN